MPSYRCKVPTCTTYSPKPGYCDEHRGKEGQTFYSQHWQDRDAKRFYDSSEWKRARANKLAEVPVCERCLIVFAESVHHLVPLSACTDVEKTDPANLQSLCLKCHSAVEAERRGIGRVE